MADIHVALANLERAVVELESYLALPINHPRGKAGLIQGFDNVADQILARLMNDYARCFRSALVRLRASQSRPL